MFILQYWTFHFHLIWLLIYKNLAEVQNGILEQREFSQHFSPWLELFSNPITQKRLMVFARNVTPHRENLLIGTIPLTCDFLKHQHFLTCLKKKNSDSLPVKTPVNVHMLPLYVRKKLPIRQESMHVVLSVACRTLLGTVQVDLTCNIQVD